MNPQLSIIIPVYQAQDYLSRSVNSILNQTYENFELLLIDDGSTDNSLKICQNFAKEDTRVKVYHQNNQGQSAARNKGLSMAQGKYIGFLDNDDEAKPELFAKLVNNAEKNNAIISCCSFVQKNEDESFSHTKHSHKFYNYNNEDGMAAFLKREEMDIYIWTKLYRQDFLNKFNIRFEPGRSDEDFLFNLAAFSHSNHTVLIHEGLHIYYHRQNSESRHLHQSQLNKYLDDTLYRLNKFEIKITIDYPSLTIYALREKLKYCIIMLGVISQAKKPNCRQQYLEIIQFLKTNIENLKLNQTFLGITTKGILLIQILTPTNYYYYRRIKRKIETLITNF